MTDREAIALLKELLSLYSPSGEEAAAAELLGERLSALGLETEIDEVGNVIATLGRPVRERGVTKPDLLLLGHIDTVPGFIPVREEDGRLYGRGAVDAKGPLVAFATALLRAREAFRGRSVVLVGAVGEEAEGEGTKHILPRFRPRMTIVGEPSGWEGITLGYKGRLLIHYRLVVPLSHSASPEPSAPERALEFWRRLSLYSRRLNRGKARAFDRLDVYLRHMGSLEDGLLARAELTMSLRLPPGLDPEELRQEISRWTQGGTLRFQGGERAFVAERNTPLVRAFLHAIRAAGGRPRFKLKTGTSDMNLVGPAWRCPVVAYGPGDSRLDHTPREHISLEEFTRGIKVLARVLRELLSYTGQLR